MEPSSEPGQLLEIADGVWTDTGPVRIVGMPLSSTMTVLRLKSGELLLCSPVAMTEQRRARVEALGRVAHLYAPNLFHHRWLGDWANAFPAARIHAPAGLGKKRPDLRIERAHATSPEPAFEGVVEELPIEGFRLRETALFYRPARTLIVTDLVHNVGEPTHRWTAIYTSLMGFRGRIALSRAIRWTGFDDRRAARRSLDAVLAHDFERVVVGHGAAVLSSAREALAAAYGWLEA